VSTEISVALLTLVYKNNRRTLCACVLAILLVFTVLERLEVYSISNSKFCLAYSS